MASRSCEQYPSLQSLTEEFCRQQDTEQFGFAGRRKESVSCRGPLWTPQLVFQPFFWKGARHSIWLTLAGFFLHVIAPRDKWSSLPWTLVLAGWDSSVCGLWFFLTGMCGVLSVLGWEPEHYSLRTILLNLFWSQLSNLHPQTRIGHMVPFLGV